MEDAFAYTVSFYYHFKSDADWVRQKADELLGAFILPPLQVVSAVVNFFILLIASRHLFDLPFTGFRDIMRSKELLEAKPASQPHRIRKSLRVVKPPQPPGDSNPFPPQEAHS